MRGAWNVFEACREHGVGAGRLRLLRQGLRRRAPSCPTARTSRCAPPTPTTPARRRPTSSPAATPHAYGLPLAVTRFANIYGGGDLNFSRLIPETAIAVLDGRPPVIRSDGSPERDFLHVDDAVAAYLAIADALGRGRREGRGLQRRRRAAALGARGGRPDRRAAAGTGIEPDYPRRRQPRRRDRPPVRRLDQAARADRLAPAGRAREGLRRTLEWYRDAPERPGLRRSRLSHVRAIHGHGQGHEEDRRPLPGRAGEGAGAELRRRGAAADRRSGRRRSKRRWGASTSPRPRRC